MAAKPGELKARWSTRERDVVFEWGGDGAAQCDGHMLSDALCGKRYRPSFKGPPGSYEAEPSLAEELEKRGFDLSTLRFSIKRKK